MRMSSRRILLAIAAVLIIGAGVGFFALVWQPAIAPIKQPSASSFAPALVLKGAQLTALGDCAVCHTAPGGKSFAGGLPIPTPFGVIYSTNITPDARTGLGHWSEAAFRRAMHDGVSRDGHYLYPAFPYDHFTNVTDQDIKAIYAFLMTRHPVHKRAHSNNLTFPINIRLVMAGWNLLFLHRGALIGDTNRSAQWSRGRYLAEGLGHCGACHTPRNGFGAEKAHHALDGGDAEGWLAPALNAASPDPVPWTAASLYTYLKTGFTAHHSFATGPMGPVVLDMRRAPDKDIHAIATYIASLQGPISPQRKGRGEQAVALAEKPGFGMLHSDAKSSGDASTKLSAIIYATSCGWCHYNAHNKGDAFVSRQKLALGIGANAPVPTNLIHVILEGIPPAEGEASPIMPGFAGSLTNTQIVALATYIRAHFSDKPAWSNVENTVKAIRQSAAR